MRKIIKTTKHSPWEIPSSRWKFYQEWNKAIFMHWEVDLEELKKHVPKELEIDLFNGKPWISVVAFDMQKIGPRSLPSFAPISDFAEVNIRTYVKSKHKTGVYFLSMEGGKKWSCRVAKSLSELPYRYARMERSHNSFKSSNPVSKDELYIEFDIGKEILEKDELDIWLTERYALFQDTATSINEFEVHHLEWPMNEVHITNLSYEYPLYKDLFKGKPDKQHFSRGVRVATWGKNKVLKSKFNKS